MEYCCPTCYYLDFDSEVRLLHWSEMIKHASLKCVICDKYPLSDALSANASDDVILALIQANKDATRQVDEYDGTLLHKAIGLKSSDTIILALLKANKGAATVALPYGNYPLHEAIDRKLSDKVILTLLEANKDVADFEGYNSSLPLHKSIESNSSDVVILALLETNKGAAKMQSFDSDLPLHMAIEEKCSDDVILAILKANRGAAKKPALNGDLPLHKAIYGKSSNTVILAVLASYTEAAGIKDRHQLLPFSTATIMDHNEGILSALLAAYPDAECRSYFQNKRLRYDAIRKEHTTADMARRLAAVFKRYKDKSTRRRAVKIIINGNRKHVLLEAAAILSDQERFDMLCCIIEILSNHSLSCSIEVERCETLLLSLLSKYPKNTSISDGDGPIMSTAIANECSDKIILSLLKANKNYAKVHASCSINPLINALKQRRSNKVIMALLTANPDSAAKLDHAGGSFPLHIAIEAKYTDDVVLALLTAYPEAAYNINPNHLMPVQHALKKNYSDAVIIALLIAAVNNSDLTGNYYNMQKLIVRAKGEELVLQAAERLSDDEGKNKMLRNLIETVDLDSLVISMVSRFPETLQMKCADGNLAMHIALEFKRSKDVVLRIFNGYKKASQEISVKGELPLHQAIRNNYSEEVVVVIFDAYKEAAKLVSKDGERPLYLAIRDNEYEGVVLAILDACREAAHWESKDGELPLHMAIKKNRIEDINIKILSAYPCAAMIRCKNTGMLPLHLAAAYSASPRLVEALIAEYPDALQIAVNNMTPKDLVTAALPMESIKLICQPCLHCDSMPSKQQDKDQKERAEESGYVKASKQVVRNVHDTSKNIEGLSNKILDLNITVKALQQRLDGLDPKYFVPPSTSSKLLTKSFETFNMPVPIDHLVTTVLKPPLLKLDSTEETTVCFLCPGAPLFFYPYLHLQFSVFAPQEAENVPFDSKGPPSLPAVHEASDISCHVASTLQTPTTAPLPSEYYELAGSTEISEEQMKLVGKQTLLTSKNILKDQKCVDNSGNGLVKEKIDQMECPSAFALNHKLICTSHLSERDVLSSEDDLSDVHSDGSNTANFNTFVLVGKHIRENSSRPSKHVDKGLIEQIIDANSNNTLESYAALDETLSLSIRSAGSFSLVDDNTSAKNG